MRYTRLLGLFWRVAAISACNAADNAGERDASMPTGPLDAGGALLPPDAQPLEASVVSEAGLTGDAASALDAAPTESAQVPAPGYDEVRTYASTIPGHADPADIYYPVANGTPLPFALLLQGANVPRAQYKAFATRVAAYGFVVVVPDHAGLLGLFAEEQQVIDTVAFVRAEATRVDSPIADIVDAERMVLLGHSYGGVAALFAVQGLCSFPFCATGFTRPPELLAAALYGSNMGDMPTMLTNAPIAVALVQGTRDGKAEPVTAEATYDKLQAPRALLSITGANHYGLCDTDDPPGAAAEVMRSEGEQTELIEAAADAAAIFLRASALKDAECIAWLEATNSGSWGRIGVRIAR